jgi:hypothetical protein
MSRAQLEGVVRALNERLPRRMRIAPEDDLLWDDDEAETGDDGYSRMTEAEMKKRIEELVGIRKVVGKNRVSKSGLGAPVGVEVPPAPKAVRTRDAVWRAYEKAPWEMDVDVEGDNAQTRTYDLGDGTEDALWASSPLATRTRTHSHSRRRSNTLPRLAILREENEIDESKVDECEGGDMRGSKRRRISFENDSEIIPIRSRFGEGSDQVRAAQGSRFIENMDVSGSPLLAMQDDGSSNGSAQCGGATASVIPSPDARTSNRPAQAPLQRRRSARIQQNALKRASSVGTGETTTVNTKRSKSSILRSKTSASRRSQTDNPAQTSVSASQMDLAKPREFTIRLPFTSTPPHMKPASSPPRILRSHSQRLAAVLNPTRSTQAKASLARSQSERFSQPLTDTAFVTINRPRYRFSRRKTKSKGAKGAEGPPLSMKTPSAQATSAPRPGTKFDAEHRSEQQECEKENEDPHIPAVPTATSGLLTFPSALASFLTPRSRAPSTSTVASSRVAWIDSPSPLPVAKEDYGLNVGVVAGGGLSEGVWQALEKMDVDSA